MAMISASNISEKLLPETLAASSCNRHYAGAEPEACAAEALARYAGAKTSCTNVSNEVAVVFSGERDSSGTRTPAFTAWNISTYTAAFFGEKPICVNAC